MVVAAVALAVVAVVAMAAVAGAVAAGKLEPYQDRAASLSS